MIHQNKFIQNFRFNLYQWLSHDGTLPVHNMIYFPYITLEGAICLIMWVTRIRIGGNWQWMKIQCRAIMSPSWIILKYSGRWHEGTKLNLNAFWNMISCQGQIYVFTIYIFVWQFTLKVRQESFVDGLSWYRPMENTYILFEMRRRFKFIISLIIMR